jgi:hypothetical protein
LQLLVKQIRSFYFGLLPYARWPCPLVVVRRKADGVKGSLEFQHNPRLYFTFRPHEGK